MRRHPRIWFFLLLVLCTTVLFFCFRGRNVLKVNNSSVASSSLAASLSSSGHAVSTNALKTAANSTSTNPFNWRVSNASKSLKQLLHDPHAILLDNALIDTSEPLKLEIPKNLQAKGDPGAYVVQARGPIGPAFRSVLAAAGATVVSYIPNNAYLVQATEAAANGLSGSPLVQAVVPYEPYYKVEAPLLAMADKPLPPEDQLNLGLYPDAAAATLKQIQQLGGIPLAWQQSPAGYTIVKVEPPSDWTAVAALPGVHIVEPFHRRHLANDLARPMLGIAADSVTPTNYLNLYGSNIIVEVNDSGIDTNHPDFNGSGAERVLYNNANNGIDTDGHGTHVAGIIAGDGTESTTVTNASGSIMPGTNSQFRGKAPLAQMFSMNFGDTDPNLQQTAASKGALISNNSWGFDGDFSYDLEAASYDAATRDSLPFTPGQQSVLYVFAAGNDGGGGTPDTITSPGTAKDIMTVGALEELRFITNQVTNADNTMSEPWLGETDDPTAVPGFSSSGNVGIGTEGTFGRYKPDVVGPGTFAVSCRSSEWDTNSYYHPISVTTYDFPDFLPTNSVSVAPFNFFVPSNTISVTFFTVTNGLSPSPLPVMPIFISTNNNSPYGFIGTNFVTIIPSPGVLNEDWSVESSNTVQFPFTYDLIVQVAFTNNLGNYYQVLQGMNDSLGDQSKPQFYRYETGTSMAAASISGFLALIQDYFTNQYSLGSTPSPALLKAMTINGSRATGTYNFQNNQSVNFEGWGEPSLSNSIPSAITNIPTAGQINTMGPLCSTYFREEGPTNALATGDSETFTVNINADDFADFLPLRVTLAWTDPPGDPSAAVKLVNSLQLVVTDVDNSNVVYFGNDIGPGQTFNTAEVATNPPIYDTVNNIQNVFIPPLLDTNYAVTVLGYRVNVNAVPEQTNNVVQDFTLVISSGDMGEVTDALQVADGGIVSSPTADQNITVGRTNTVLINQTAGANSPLLGTNIVSMQTNTDSIGGNSQFTAGVTNQWHFYIVTNFTTFTNAAFITYGATTLAIPREGVYANSDANATTPGADLDVLVTRTSSDPNAAKLLNLDPIEISNCVAGLSGDGSSLVSGGTDFVAYTNAVPNETYYIGVKSESHMGVEYNFIPIFTQTPFGGTDTNGNAYVNALNVPQNIPDGTPAHPGVGTPVFMINLHQVEIQNVVITNTILHQNFGDLVGSIKHGNTTVVLNSHDSLPNPPGPYTLIYDDSGQNDITNSRPSDGPGSLRDYDGTQGQGVWILTEEGTALAQTGAVINAQMFLQKHQDLQHGLTISVAPGEWFYDYINVPNGITNLDIFGTNLTPSATLAPLPIQMYLLQGSQPTFTDFDFKAFLTNGVPPGNEISDGPPLAPGVYWVGIFNPNAIGTSAQQIFLLAQLNGINSVEQPTFFSSTNSSPISVDAVTNTTVFVNNSNIISSVNVGMVVQYPRISDLAFTLLSPMGDRILLMENRGGPGATNAGGVFFVTNFVGTIDASGTGIAQTNVVPLGSSSGSVSINYNFFTKADEMTVYYGTNPATFTAASPYLLFDSGLIGNFTGFSNVVVSFPPPGATTTSTNLTIIMNQFGNSNGVNDAWEYNISGIEPEYNFLTFTDDTNLSMVPIKFAIPPFDLRDAGTNFTFSDFDLATNGDYSGLTNIYDPYGGWTVPTNQFVGITNGVLFTNSFNIVSIISDPANVFLSSTNNSTSNILALGLGMLVRTNLVSPFHMVTFSYNYRGPGIAGWWRGEGDGRDSSDAEQRGQNGSLIGRFDFPVGEVSQAFEMENNGGAFDFAGTNSYVQIRQQPIYTLITTNAGGSNIQSSFLDVGTGPGLTVEGWIDPTNVSTQEPLVEWLARVPTNGSDTNLQIRAGPFLDRGTSHYYYLLSATNWTTSEVWAEQLGGHLAAVDTADEQNWIYDTFADYGGKNRNLWIGLTNLNEADYGFVSGLTNIAYTNWMSFQPTNENGTRNYTFMYGGTNRFPGLWVLANNNGFIFNLPTLTNIVYGVAEVTNLQTNGVQFWISITNVPGTTNLITTNMGCLFANLVDTTNGSHWIFSPPGLVQSNLFQHVALTYDTNSGIANLFYQGTNVASTNLGVFIPKTTGDVLLGKDMSLETNNYFGGLMDEMSIYGRALSDAEIAAIYHVSAYTTNRLIGKFDPTVTPPENLAEAEIVLGSRTNILLGENTTWQSGDFSFESETNALPMEFIGIEPGMLFDSFTFSEEPLNNLYYQPEQALAQLKGEKANGNWTLEIWNTRNNTLATNAQVLNWQLQMILQTNTLPPVSIGPQEPTPITVPPGQTVSLLIDTPIWATVAQNTLLASTLPLNVFFNTNGPPVGVSPPDIFMYASSGANNGGNEAISTASAPTNFIPGKPYYIGLQNPGASAASAVFEVSFDITALTNDVPFNTTLTNVNGSVRYFSFNVTSTNAYEATFQLLRMNGNCDLVVSKGTLPTLTSSDYGSFNSGHANENIYVLTNSTPVPLTRGTWYLGVFNRDVTNVNYTVLAQELDLGAPSPTFTNELNIVPLTNGVPFDFTAGPGAALTNFFSFVVTNSIVVSNGVPVTNYVSSVHFQLYNMSGNGDLTVETDAPPFAPPFFQSSHQPGTLPEFIQVTTNNVLTNLTHTWYLGVPNQTTNLIYYTILAVIDTNITFPAFPGAEGAGAGALGASYRNGYTNNTVYHVVNLNDSGAGSLRDAVSSTNRTIIFDVSGLIYLQSPLVITNSYLTIVGQTAPDGGITVAGQTLAVQSAHDVVIRDVRLRSSFSFPAENMFVGADLSANVIEIDSNLFESAYAGGLPYPNSLAFDSTGNLFVGALQANQVIKILTNRTETTFANVNQPDALAFDKGGNLYVSSGAPDNAIYKYTPAGVRSTFASGMDNPQSLAFDRYGNLFVGNSVSGDPSGGGYIVKITPAGIQSTFVSGLSTPNGLAFDGAGNLYVTEGSGTATVLKITTNGVQSTFASGLNQPIGLTFNYAGDLFIADGGAGAGPGGDITQLDPNGKVKLVFTSINSKPLSVAFQGEALPITVVPGSAATPLQLNAVSNIMSDHLSITWSTNANLTILNSTNVTVQWSIISDSLHGTDTLYGAGSVIDTNNGAITLHHNLYADNAYANPQIGGNLKLDFVNNVISDWGTNAGVSDDNAANTYTNYLNYVGNYLIATTNSLTNTIAFWSGATNTWIFQTNNFIDSDTNGFLNGANTRWGMFTNHFTETNQFPLPAVTVDEAYLAYEKVLDFAGVNLLKRDLVDSNIVENVRTETGTIISNPGNLPSLSSSSIYIETANDGLPDFWKLTFGQAVTNAENNNLIDASGYSELEEYDNWLAAPHAITVTNTPVGVDLNKVFGKTGVLSYWLTNAIHGTVYLTNVLGAYTNTSTFSNSIAIFTPTNSALTTTNYSGFASFDVVVTNNDTYAYFGPETVSVFVSALTPELSVQSGSLTNGLSVTNIISGNTIQWYLINVPSSAVAATNSLLFAGAPLNLWFSSNAPPTTANFGDFELLTGSTNGSAVINIDGAPLPPVLMPGGTYYLGVENTNTVTTNYAIEVTFDLAISNATPLHAGQPITNSIPGGGSVTNYSVFVPPNAIAATNILLFATGSSVNLWFNQIGLPIENNPPDTELLTAFTGATPGIGAPILTTNSVPPLVPGQTYYLSVQNPGVNPVTFAIEVNFEYFYTPPFLPSLTNLEVAAGTTLIVTNTATDTNAGTLFYSLGTTPPVGANISSSGIITWDVPGSQPAGDVLFTTIVTNSFTDMSATNSFIVTVLPLVTPTQPQTNTVPANTTAWLTVNVPFSANQATNILFYSTNLAVNVLFTTNFPPAVAGAFTLMFDETNGIALLGLATTPTNIVSGGTYYIGIQNTNATAIGYAFGVNFGYYPPPVLPAITNLVVIRGTTLTVTNTATDVTSGTLAYTLTTSPAVGASISTNGIITWNVPANQTLGDYIFTTVVTNAFTTLGATNTFIVDVIPVPPAVTFSSIVYTNIGGINGFLLSWFAPTNDTFQVQETTNLQPVVWNTFAGTVTYTGPLTPTNGLFQYFDNGLQYPFGPERFYRLVLLLQAIPNPLALLNQANIIATVSQPISVVNTAVDGNPAASLAYSLVVFPAPATNATISATGVIHWTPGPTDSGGAYKFTTGVIDNGLPPATATNAFTIFVQPPPAIANTIVTSTNVTFNWTAPTNDLFQVEWTTNLNYTVIWHTFPQTITSASGSFTFTDTNTPATMKFYRLTWLPLP